MLAAGRHKRVSEVQRSLHTSVFEYFEQVSTVRDSAARAKCGRHMDGFRQLIFTCACDSGLLPVQFDAVRTLRRERNRDRHQLFVLLRNGAVRECEFVPGSKRRHRFRCELAYVRQFVEI